MDTIITGIGESALSTTTTTGLTGESLFVVTVLLVLALRGLLHVATGSPFDGQSKEDVDSENKE